MQQLRIAFMGSPAFSVPSLKALVDAGHDVACVYAQPPRPAGRGHKETLCPVHAAANDMGIPVRTPVNLKADEDRQAFADLNLDVAVVVAYGLILPQPVLDAPRLGCVNVHASLLPRWRGAAPIQRAIMAGDEKTGVCIMQMEAGLDTGPVLARAETPIAPNETATTLHDRLSEMGAAAIGTALEDLAAGKIEPEPQPEDGVTYASKLTKDESSLDFSEPAHALERKVRALNPWPGVSFGHDGTRIKVGAAAYEDQTTGKPPGTVLDDRLSIACGEGVLRPMVLQRPGRGMTPVDEFLRGYPIPAGTVLKRA